MGEPASLRRSISYPCREVNEVDPLRALTESVSFGRFMSESLAWEKWSTFSHNRYREEAEYLSELGSVAEKKAYFEAHYKKRAVMKEASALEKAVASQTETNEVQSSCSCDLNADNADSREHMLNEASTSNHPPQSETANQSSCPVDMQLDNANYYVVADKPLENDISRADILACSSSRFEMEDANTNVGTNGSVSTTKDEEQVVVGQNVGTRTESLVENLQLSREAKDHEVIKTIHYKCSVKKPVGGETSASKSKEARVTSSKSQNFHRDSKIPLCPAKRIASAKLEGASNADRGSKKISRNLRNEKNSEQKTLHMSVNFSSSGVESCKVAASVSQPTENNKVHANSTKAPNDSSTPQKNLIRASISGISKRLPNTSKSDDRRSKLLNKSISGPPRDEKCHAASTDSESSTASGNKARSSIMFSPFKFRSEERAAKRKEKLEEKVNAIEAEKLQPQTRLKRKAEIDPKVLQNSVCFRNKGTEEVDHGSKSLNKHTKKVSITNPCLPKLGRKTTTTTTIVHEASSRPPQGPSNSTAGSRQIDRYKQRKTASITSLRKKPAQENASPNIQT